MLPAAELPAQAPELQKLAQEYLASSVKNREQARALAQSGGWPVRGVTRQGRVFELQGLQNGLPLYYTTANTEAARTTRTDTAQVFIGGGSGITIGLWDGGAPRLTHQELYPRATWGDAEHAAADDHATHVAGTMIARGARPRAKGMAYEAAITAYQWDDDLAEMANEAAHGLLLSNHSYGPIRGWFWYDYWYWFGDTTISEVEDYKFGFYDDLAEKLDALLWAAPNYLVVNSAGNDRNDSVAAGTEHLYWDSGTGSWRWSSTVRDNDGAPFGYDCIPNGFTIAKNSLTVGAVKPVLDYTGPADVEMTPYSSWGPTDDGRIKPDICGDGWDVYSCIAVSDTSYDYYYGTSMASPNVCGSLALLQRYYKDRHHGASMRAATLKALIIHTAREAGAAPGPDYSFGWGLLDTYAAYEQILLDVDERRGAIEELALNEGAPLELTYECDGTAPELRATICWTDPPGTSPAPALDPPDIMLVNDLDLRVSKDAATFEPWVLDPAQPMNPATKGDNVRDNVEQIVVETPEAGRYVIRIDHKGTLRGGSQNFSLIVSGAARAKTWNVYRDGSGDAPTIAAAVDSAASGEYILVYPGEYAEHDIVVDKAVVIKGVYGPAYTRVNAHGLGRCFVLEPESASMRLEDLTLKRGAAEGAGMLGWGGAVLCRSGAMFVNCVVTGSTAREGGGVFVDGASPSIVNCKVYANVADERGGGVYLSSADASFERSIIAQNAAGTDGGAVYGDESNPSFVNCTLSHNRAGGHGGGVYVGAGSQADLETSIIAFGSGGAGLYGDEDALGASLFCCDVFGNDGGEFGGSISNQIGENGTISVNPQFCDPAAVNYGIGDGSLCLPDGNSCGVLIGARELGCHLKTTWYVKADGTGDAPTIQAAIDRAFDGDTILVATGSYTGDGNRDISYGGKALVVKSLAGPESTVVDGESSESSLHVGFDFATGEDTTSVLDGFTVRGACIGGVRCIGSSPVIRNCIVTANVTIGGTRGGGFYLDTSSARIFDCTVTGNRADANGGGFFCKGGNPRIERCIVSGNVASKYGGGMAVQSGSVARVRSSVISADTAATESGGGIYVIGASAHIDSCVVSTSEGKFGGGVYVGANASMTLAHSTVFGNAARQGGGGVYSSSNMTMEDCTVVGNSAVYYGGGIENSVGNVNPISRSIVAFNTGGGGIYTISTTQSIACSDVYGNVGGDYAGSTADQTGTNGNISADPRFCDSDAGDFGIFDTSPCAPAVSPCASLIGARGVSCRIAPNLVVAKVEFGAASPAAHDSIAAAVTVKNTGVAAADTFMVDFYRNRAFAPSNGQAGDERFRVDGLAVGDSVTWITSRFTSDTIGVWRSFFAVDIDDRVLETREDDNASGPFLVSWRIPRQPGWPVAMGGGSFSSPLLVDLDAEATTLEVVSGCWDGKLYAWSSGGDALPGWPVDVGGTISTSPAAGDIAGDSRKEVVVVNANDQTVHAFDASGNELWQADVPMYGGTTPVLADLDGDGPLEVLVAGGNAIYLFKGDGSPYLPSLIGLPDGTDALSPAVGDVDGDGSVEIGVVAGSVANVGWSHVYLYRTNGAPYPGDWPKDVPTFVSADPVIGDVALSHAEMEIVVAGEDGLVRAWAPDGLPCIRYGPSRVPGSVRTSPALANMDRDGYHDIVVVSERPYVLHGGPPGEGYLTVINSEGAILSADTIARWSEPSIPVASPIVIGTTPVVIAGAPDSSIHANAYGFPLEVARAVSVSVAAGDIDGDGSVELVAASGDSIYCFELCSPAYPAGALWWALFRRDAERTACYGYEPQSGIDEGDRHGTPAATALRSIYPNPFNPMTRVQFELSARARVELAIFDIAGRRVSVLVDREMDAGRYEVVWNGRTTSGRPAASGVYVCRFRAGAVVETRKMVLVR
jgi:hypothetical protein